jgi:hypothetical protein
LKNKKISISKSKNYNKRNKLNPDNTKKKLQKIKAEYRNSRKLSYKKWKPIKSNWSTNKNRHQHN